MLSIAELSEKKYYNPNIAGHNEHLNRFIDDYEVWINEIPCDVSACRVSAVPFNRVWPGHERSLDQTELASYISFSSDEIVTLRVKCKRAFENAVVRPLSKGVVLNRCENELTFTLEKPGQYVLELDGIHYALHIFFNPPLKYDQADIDNATYHFGPGIHHQFMIHLKDNDSIYVDENAIVYTGIRGEDVKNIRIFGGGVLKGSRENRVTGFHGNGIIRLLRCQNVSVEDVILQDSTCYAMTPSHCENLKINNVKIIGQWRYNSDGITMGGPQNVEIRNSFIRTFDDVISICGNTKVDKVHDVLVDNCVLWCDWNMCCQIGLQTSSLEITDITFRNCDIIHTFSAFDILNGGYAEVHNIVYENINVEFQKNALPMAFQESDDETYHTDEKFIPTLIRVENFKYSAHYGSRGNNVTLDQRYGLVHDIYYKNIHVYLEEGCEPLTFYIHSDCPDTVHHNFFIEDLYINGEKQTSLDGISMDIENAQLPILK